MSGITIKTPNSCTVQSSAGNAELKWNSSFSSSRSNQFNKRQEYVDSEVLRLDSPLVPFQTGNLEKSGTLGTTVGSGEVKYIAPYASYQYYCTKESRSYDSNRGAKWFERMKASNLKSIKDGIDKI